jgi:hypothetical protein
MSVRYSVLLVYSTAHALKIERLLSRGGVPCRLIPLPSHLSSDSGVCVRINALDRDLAERILQANGATVDGVHSL